MKLNKQNNNLAFLDYATKKISPYNMYDDNTYIFSKQDITRYNKIHKDKPLNIEFFNPEYNNKITNFYNKALLNKYNGGCQLISYTSLICEYCKKSNTIKFNKDILEYQYFYLSHTTLKHIASFTLEFINKSISKKEILDALTNNNGVVYGG